MIWNYSQKFYFFPPTKFWGQWCPFPPTRLINVDMAYNIRIIFCNHTIPYLSSLDHSRLIKLSLNSSHTLLWIHSDPNSRNCILGSLKILLHMEFEFSAFTVDSARKYERFKEFYTSKGSEKVVFWSLEIIFSEINFFYAGCRSCD